MREGAPLGFCCGGETYAIGFTSVIGADITIALEAQTPLHGFDFESRTLSPEFTDTTCDCYDLKQQYFQR